MKHRHGFTLTHADREFLGEPECCICGTTEGVMHIDHCHSTNKIRGWLCANHNQGIGMFADNIEHLEKAVIYLSTNV